MPGSTTRAPRACRQSALDGAVGTVWCHEEDAARRIPEVGGRRKPDPHKEKNSERWGGDDVLRAWVTTQRCWCCQWRTKENAACCCFRINSRSQPLLYLHTYIEGAYVCVSQREWVSHVRWICSIFLSQGFLHPFIHSIPKMKSTLQPLFFLILYALHFSRVRTSFFC